MDQRGEGLTAPLLVRRAQDRGKQDQLGMGLQGAAGCRGLQGVGLQGAGLQGEAGCRGLQGVRLQGEAGCRGLQEEAGCRGLQGAGLQGEAGCRGLQAEAGCRGLRVGLQGMAGFQGAGDMLPEVGVLSHHHRKGEGPPASQWRDEGVGHPASQWRDEGEGPVQAVWGKLLDKVLGCHSFAEQQQQW